jgi:hypothetical protein
MTAAQIVLVLGICVAAAGIGYSALFGVSELISQLTWWSWRRWRIYVPKYDVTKLFPQDRALIKTPLGIMETPGSSEWDGVLFHYDEAFVAPCTLNEKWAGGVRGKWTPKIKLIGLEEDARFKDDE